MSEYNMTHTGAELDAAVAKVQSGYILPSGTKEITENGTADVKNYEKVNVNVNAQAVTITQYGANTFTVDADKKGASNADSPWYGFTPDFTPKFIYFMINEGSGVEATIYNSTEGRMLLSSIWVDDSIEGAVNRAATAYYKGSISKTAYGQMCTGARVRYDSGKNLIYLYASSSDYYLLKAGNYIIKYWG